MLFTKNKFECQCQRCKAACIRKPGWFLPEEAEKAAEYLGISLQEFFNKYLGVDWWVTSEPIFVLAPALVGEETGTEYPGKPDGQCVFYKNGLCDIHPVKPYECVKLICGDPGASKRHKKVSEAWKNHQEQITKLLGRKPKAEKFYGDNLCYNFF